MLIVAVYRKSGKYSVSGDKSYLSHVLKDFVQDTYLAVTQVG